MPIYLCKSGYTEGEPWVYAYPFQIQDPHILSTYSVQPQDNNRDPNVTNTMTTTTTTVRRHRPGHSPSSGNRQNFDPGYDESNDNQSHFTHPTGTTLPPGTGGRPIRRIRRAEVVLVDQVLLKYGSYWLRLRWPGPRGGVAGYIELGNSLPGQNGDTWRQMAAAAPDSDRLEMTTTREGVDIAGERDGVDSSDHYNQNEMEQFASNDVRDQDRVQPEYETMQDTNRPLDLPSSMDTGVNQSSSERRGNSPSNEFINDNSGALSYQPICEATGLYYPTSASMELLGEYDDGLATLTAVASETNSVDDDAGAAASGSGEPVFCRICREGIHDVDYDYSLDGGSKSNTASGQQSSAIAQTAATPGGQNHRSNTTQADMVLPNDDVRNPPPAVQIRHPYKDNPLLAPCDCSGSMKFVHLFCIEQWRCRSNHPAAQNGLNCETCKVCYDLPPPKPRPTGTPTTENEGEDWMDGMPAHVVHALQNPHIWWRIASSIARRRWLRPIAPVIISPIVALYCRARRSLKKRGVSRRRWACSLCRRRARWKCVRCLRSYYCSRHCQNVSWHIVHKHVCYKPHRFWESMVFYGFLYVKCVPNVMKYPMVYDCGFGLLWLSFTSMGIIGGSIASTVKKRLAYDMRGRTLEALVVLSTLLLGGLSWALVWAFFLGPSQCWGVADKVKAGLRFTGLKMFQESQSTRVFPLSLPFFQSQGRSADDIGPALKFMRNCVLHPIMMVLRMVDKATLAQSPRVTNRLCTTDLSTSKTCFHFASDANPDFILAEQGGEKCASDMNIVLSIFSLAGCVLIWGNIWKRRERMRRAADRGNDAAGDEIARIARGNLQRQHLHQD